MNKRLIFLLAFVIFCLAAGSVLKAAPDNPDGGFTLPWWTVDAGGGTSQGGRFSLSGTAGQADTAQVTGGPYTLTSGFWNSVVGEVGGGEGVRMYLPLIIR